MSADPRLPRWTETGSEAPAELRDWLRASREQVASPADVVQLSRSLAQRLGPEAGLVASRAPLALGKAGFATGRWAAWLAAGAGSAAVVWYLASGLGHGAPPPAALPTPAVATPASPAEPSGLAAAERAELVAPEPALVDSVEFVVALCTAAAIPKN